MEEQRFEPRYSDFKNSEINQGVEGGQNLPPPNMLLWYKDYLEGKSLFVSVYLSVTGREGWLHL